MAKVHNWQLGREMDALGAVDLKRTLACERRNNMNRPLLLAAGGLIVLAAITALLTACDNEEDGAAQIQATERTIYMEAVEPKGSANVEEEPFPTAPLPEGGGYVLEEPDEEGNWVVETYTWAPDQIVVYEGDTINLEIIGINGAQHESFIEEYVDSFVVERGKIASLSFTADTAGVFRIVCTTHQPSMTGALVVLPRP
jgi:plastocyanin